MNEQSTPSPQSGKARWLLVLGVAIAMLVLVGQGLSSQRPLESAPAPDFTLTTFDGGAVSLRALRDQVVVLNFWASWCGPCREEAEILEKLWREYQSQGVSFVGVNLNDPRSNALAFLDEFGITYPNGPDPYGRVAAAFRVRKVPETFLISKDGLIQARIVGAVVERELRASLNQLLRTRARGA